MEEIYARVGGEGKWHNEHVYWRQCYEVLGPVVPFANPDRPHSRAANLTRWTGYDVDIIKDSIEGRWHRWPVLLSNLLASCPTLGRRSAGKISIWLDTLFDAYVAAWFLEPSAPLVDHNLISFVGVHRAVDPRRRTISYQSHFSGCRWAPQQEHDGTWYRPLGPGGGAILLHRTTQRSGFVIDLKGLTFGTSHPRELAVAINDRAPSGRSDRPIGNQFVISVYIAQDRIIECEGRLVIKLVDTAYTSEQKRSGFGFTEYFIQPYARDDQELEALANSRSRTDAIQSALALWSEGASVVPPSLTRLRELALSETASEHATTEFGARVLGLGWTHPFRHRGERFRWASGEGNEVIVVRLQPGFAYRVQFSADSWLSSAELITACVLQANGSPLSHVQIDIVGGKYLISGQLGRERVNAYDGWLALRLVSGTAGHTHGKGRIEFGEPAAGGIALKTVHFEALGVSFPETAELVPASGSESLLAEFWRSQLATAFAIMPAHPEPCRRACKLLGVDPSCYESVSRRYGGRVMASWMSCQPAAADDISNAQRWLECLDREIFDAWRSAGGPTQDANFELSLVDECDGTGFGEIFTLSGAVGRSLAPHYPALSDRAFSTA